MKRMIDNKEFNKIKQDIININEEIEKNKGVPTITIEASQMSGVTCQLTDEQFEILNNYPVVYIVLADGRTATYYKETLASQSENIINFITFANDVNQADEVETYAFIMIIDKTDKTAIYSFDKVGGSSKKLYQHNFTIKGERYAGGTYNYIFCGVSFTSDDNTAITTYDLLKAYLVDKGYTSQNSHMLCSVNGISKNNSANIDMWILGIYYNTSEDRLYCKRTNYSNTQYEYWTKSDIDESQLLDNPKEI